MKYVNPCATDKSSDKTKTLICVLAYNQWKNLETLLPVILLVVVQWL